MALLHSRRRLLLRLEGMSWKSHSSLPTPVNVEKQIAQGVWPGESHASAGTAGSVQRVCWGAIRLCGVVPNCSESAPQRVCVLLIATLTGCASPFRPKPFLPSMSIPLECTTGIRLVGRDLSFKPAALPYSRRHLSQGLGASGGGQMRFLLGFLAGLVWSNWIEYAYHRWAMHWPSLYQPAAMRHTLIILRLLLPSTSQ